MNYHTIQLELNNIRSCHMEHTRLIPLGVSFVLLFVWGCDSDNTRTSDLVDEPGVIRVEGATYLIEMPAVPQVIGGGAGPFLIFPLNLPVAFQQEGLAVEFSANLEECNDTASCIALPVTLTDIRQRPTSRSRTRAFSSFVPFPFIHPRPFAIAAGRGG